MPWLSTVVRVIGNSFDLNNLFVRIRLVGHCQKRHLIGKTSPAGKEGLLVEVVILPLGRKLVLGSDEALHMVAEQIELDVELELANEPRMLLRMAPAVGVLNAELEPLRHLIVRLVFRFNCSVIVDRGIPFGNMLRRPGAFVSP